MIGGNTTNLNDFNNVRYKWVSDWYRQAEDGYLTLRFRALWGGQKVHYINLVTGVNPENPRSEEHTSELQSLS